MYCIVQEFARRTHPPHFDPKSEVYDAPQSPIAINLNGSAPSPVGSDDIVAEATSVAASMLCPSFFFF